MIGQVAGGQNARLVVQIAWYKQNAHINAILCVHFEIAFQFEKIKLENFCN